MKNKLTVMIAAVGMLAGAVPMFAHHSFAAEYDINKPLTIKGTVSKVEWMNPHAYFYVDAKDEKTGKMTTFACETGSPNALMRSGWTRNSLKIGDEVIVDAFGAKDGSTTVNARTVKLSDGRKVFAGSSNDGGPSAGTTLPGAQLEKGK